MATESINIAAVSWFARFFDYFFFLQNFIFCWSSVPFTFSSLWKKYMFFLDAVFCFNASSSSPRSSCLLVCTSCSQRHSHSCCPRQLCHGRLRVFGYFHHIHSGTSWATFCLARTALHAIYPTHARRTTVCRHIVQAMWLLCHCHRRITVQLNNKILNNNSHSIADLYFGITHYDGSGARLTPGSMRVLILLTLRSFRTSNGVLITLSICTPFGQLIQ